MDGIWSEFAEEGLEDSELRYNSGMIRIIRPTNSRDQFGDGADYKGDRSEVYRTFSKEVKPGKEGAEQMFHILNGS